MGLGFKRDVEKLSQQCSVSISQEAESLLNISFFNSLMLAIECDKEENHDSTFIRSSNQDASIASSHNGHSRYVSI